MDFKNNIENSFHLLKEKKKIVIIPHKNPDADALGSSLAWYKFLLKKGHTVKVISPNLYPKFLSWLPFSNEILIAESNIESAKKYIESAEIIFCLDFNTLSRVDELENLINSNKGIKILVDHHQDPDDFDYVYSDTQIPATSQLIYHLIEMLGDESLIDHEIATCLYAGIIADTGNFRFPSVKSSTHQVASKLIEKGVSPSKIYTSLFENTSIHRLKLLSQFLSEIKYFDKYKCAVSNLSKTELLKFDYEKGDTEGFVNYGLMIDGCVLSISLFEDIYKDNTIKISFRSRGDFNVNDFAKNHFNGGGHINAAGGVSNLSMNETLSKISCLLDIYKNELNSTVLN